MSFKITNEMFSAELKDMESPTFKSLSRGLELEVMYVGIFFFLDQGKLLLEREFNGR